MKVGYFQFEPKFGAVKENLAFICNTVQSQMDLLVLPELCISGYQFVSIDELSASAEEIPDGKSTQQLIELASYIKGTIVAGLPERDGDRFYNSAVVVNPAGYVGKYRKVHLFYEEEDFFTPGDMPFPVFDIGPATIGVMICFDWVFPEAARTLSLKGSDILCLPSNLVLPFCQRAMIIRAIENQVYTIVTNRIGREKRADKKALQFTGNSQIADSKGNILASASENGVEVQSVDIDPKLAQNKWLTERNHIFKDRRTDFYELY